MTNEGLVLRIKEGETGLIPQLWEQVERFVWQKASRRHYTLNGFGGVTAEDLYQAGFFALLRAVESYEPGAGMSFVGWLAIQLKDVFAETAGYKTIRGRREPLNNAASLEEVIADDGDSFTIADTLVDTQAERAFVDIEIREMAEIVSRAVKTLSDQQREVVRLRYWSGLNLEEAGRVMGINRGAAARLEQKAMLRLRHPGVNPELHKYAKGNAVT